MAKTIKINGIEEVKKLIEEGRVFIPHSPFMDSVKGHSWYRDGVHIPDESLEAHEWKTIRVEARPEHIDPKSAVLEARVGEDGIFRVESETIQEEELARLRSIVGKRIQKDIDELMRGMWENK